MTSSEYEFYGWNTPNGQKVAIALEEVGADYTYQPIDISEGEQHEDAFRALSPDGKIPALVHHAASTITLFESGAILVYLAEQFPVLHGDSPSQRAAVLSWTFWQVGQLGPLSGQFGRFQIVEPPNPEAIKHFEGLVWRCLSVMEKQLSVSAYLAGRQFSIADIASYPWVASPQSYLQRYCIGWRDNCPSLVRWADSIATKPSVIKALESV